MLVNLSSLPPRTEQSCGALRVEVAPSSSDEEGAPFMTNQLTAGMNVLTPDVDGRASKIGAGQSAMPLDFASQIGGNGDCMCGCCCCCCDSIGNLHVICERPVGPGERRELWCVMGPYWAVISFITTPLIILPSIGAILYMAPLVPPVRPLCMLL